MRHRKDTKKITKTETLSTLSQLFSSNVKAPTTLIELTSRDYNRMKKNSIYVSGMSRVIGNKKDKSATTTLYSKVTYGPLISITKNKININKTRNKYVVLVADKVSC